MRSYDDARLRGEIRDDLSEFDFFSLLVTALLVGVGLTLVYSATFGSPMAGNFSRQVLWAALGSVAIAGIVFIPSRWLYTLSYPIYFVLLGLLAVTIVAGRKVAGAEAWLYIGPIGLQPSEMTKLGTVLALSSWLSDRRTDPTRVLHVIVAVLIVLVPMGLVLAQNDTGTALVFAALLLPMLYWAGLPLGVMLMAIFPVVAAIAGYFSLQIGLSVAVLALGAALVFRVNPWIALLGIAATIGAAYATPYIYHHVLQPHQQQRIAIMFDPSVDRLGAGYNVIQSKVAIGSGGLWGKGFLQGTQTQLRFIPEQWTDFIFCVLGEEFGFVGCVTVLGLFAILILRLVGAANATRSQFASLIAIGAATIFTVHIVINTGMTMGILPTIGIPLPFLSYGGSALLTNLAFIGIVLNFQLNRRDFLINPKPEG